MEFRLQPILHCLDRNDACIRNLKGIVDAIVVYYDHTKGWSLESNIPIEDVFEKHELYSLCHG